ncbi:MAG: D-alanyl-D-alanine carboxypeptidase family protein [Velocimicrobium sp.]
MRKFFLIVTSILVISFVAYRFLTPARTWASNSPSETEYYYNKNQLGDTFSMIDASNLHPTNNLVTTYIDTKPSSTTVLVNKEYALPSDYVPPDLKVPDIIFSFSSYSEKKLMREEAGKALASLFEAANEEGLNLYGVSGYRSYKRQLEIYNKNLAKDGADLTNLYSAKAGCSEHQTGLSIDVSTQSIHNRLDTAFAATPEGKFIANHSYEYGFIIRYPSDKSEITGYAYEPWHIRYVGTTLANYLYENNLCLEEYYNYAPNDTLSSDTTYGTTIDVEDYENFTKDN